MSVPDARMMIVADAFIEELNTALQGWRVGTRAELKFSVQYDLEQLASLHVDVQTVTFEDDIADRGGRSTDLYGINVVVQQKVDPTNTAVIRALASLLIAIFLQWKKEDHVGELTTVSLLDKQALLYSPVLLDGDSRYFGTAGFVFQETVS